MDRTRRANWRGVVRSAGAYAPFMDSGPKASLCHGEHIRVQRKSCRVIEGFTLVHRIDRKASKMIPDRTQVIKEFQRTKGA
jgi:hypothetical protein